MLYILYYLLDCMLYIRRADRPRCVRTRIDSCRTINHYLDNDQFTVTLVTVVGPLFRPTVDFSVSPRREQDSQTDLKDVSGREGPGPRYLSRRSGLGGRVAPQGAPGNEPRASINRAKGLQKAIQDQLLIDLEQT